MIKKNSKNNRNELRKDNLPEFKKLFEFFPYPFYIINVDDYSISFTNVKIKKNINKNSLFCHELSHGSKKPCSELDHVCPVREVKKTKKLVVLEHLHKDKNGKDINVRLMAYPIFNKAKKLTKIVEYHIDITEEKNDKMLLSESETILSSMVNSVQDVIFTKDKNLKYTRINTVAEKYFKKENSKLIGKDDSSIYSKSEISKIKDLDNRVLLGETIKEDVVKKINEEERIFQKTKTPLIDKKGEIIGICGIAHDITDSRKRETELVNINRLNKDILENSPVGMFVINKEGRAIYVNQKMIEMSGRTFDNFVSINFLKHAPYENIGLLDKIKSCFDGNKFRMEAIKYTSVIGKKETMRNFIGLPVGEVDSPSVLIIVEDITEMERKKEDLEKRNNELEVFNNIAVNRELRMIDLKNEIKKLKKTE
ncbi:MAG: PAS domain-containing protein [Patescibacteria group bacterium]|jgi:PAS domain S-box-containing protein|nr:PAS domain-containing protein [Patescibacteria group bacterium]